MATKPTTGIKSVGIKKEEIKKTPPPAGQQYVQQPDGSYKSFAIPGAPPAPPKPQAGVFTNKTTGAQVDAKGNPIGQPVPFEAPNQTAEQRAQSLIRNEYADANKYSAELGFEKDLFPTGIQGMIDELAGQQKQKMSEAEQSVAEADRAAEFDVSTFKKGAESQIAGVKALYAQGREGAMSTTNPLVSEQVTTALKGRIDDAISRKEQARIQRQNALNDLRIAQKQGRRDAAQAAQDMINRAEETIKQADTDLLNAQTAASEEYRAGATALSNIQTQQAEMQRQNLNTFSTLVETGAELTPQALKSLSTQLGLDFETAFDFYEGSKAIRDDKSLSLEEKQIKNQQLAQNLQDTISGQNIAEVKKLTIIENLYKSGASQEEISRAKDAFGLTDDQDPVYQAELRIKLADATMKEMAAKGEVPYGSTDWIDRQSAAYDLAGKQKDFYAQYGGTWDPEAFKIGEAVGWCGEYASTLSTAPRVGDMWSEKRTKINDKNPSIGDKLLVPLGGANGYGHVAVVLGYDPTTGDIQVAESNADGRQNKGAGLGVATFGNYNVFELNQKFGDDWGVAHGNLKPEYAKAFNAGKGVTTSGKIVSTVKLLAKTSDKKDIEENINALVGSGDARGLQDYVTRIAVEDLPAADQTKMLLRTNIVGRGNELVAKMKAYEAAGGDLGIFQGTSTTIQNKIGKIDNPQAQELAQAIRLNLEDFGRAQTGAAVQDFENKKFQDILPSLFDGSELAEIKINSFAQALETDAKSTLKFKLGEEVYNQVFGGQTQTETVQQPKMNPLLQFVINKMDASNVDDLYAQAANLPSDTSEFDAVWSSPLTPSK